MTDHHSGLTRRELVKVSVAATALAGLATADAAAQSPVASPAIDTTALQQVSTGLVGGGQINADALPILAALVAVDEQLAAALPTLANLQAYTTEAVAALDEDARRLATNILQFWYLGRWEGEPIEERADLYFSLVSWQALPYSTQQTVCKAFGYWATEVAV